MSMNDEKNYRKLTLALKKFADSEGWDVFGIADPEPLNQKAKPGRRPKDVYPEAKAIVCLGSPTLDKWTRIWFRPQRTGMASVISARSAMTRLKVAKLLKWLKDQGYHAMWGRIFLPGFREAEAFRQAGLGYVGKSQLLITPKYGSRLILNSILTNAPLIPDKPYEGEECGDCKICQNNCPSGAILGDWYYQAQVCENYINSKKHQQYFSKWGTLDCHMCMRVCPKGEIAWEKDNKKWPELFQKNWASGIAKTSDYLKELKKHKKA